MRRFDLTIYEPASAPLYLDNAASMGGAERQMVLLARSLAELGLRVCHVVASTEGLPERCDGVELVQQEPTFSGIGWRTRLRRIADALRRADAHVYLQRSAGLATGVVGVFARSRRSGFIFSTSSPLDLTRGLPLLWHEFLGVKVGQRLAEAVVVQTHDQLAVAPRGLKLVHIPSFCELADGDGEQERNTFLWAGRPVSYKNPLAFVELARAVPEARFVMVGVDLTPPRDPMVECILARGAALPNLELVPPLPRSALLTRYCRAVAVVNTSDFEGFPNTFMEGWARGALALSLRVDPDQTLTRHGIGEVAAGSPEVLACAARRLWEERGGAQARREAAIQYVRKNHAPKEVARRWFDTVTAVRTQR